MECWIETRGFTFGKVCGALGTVPANMKYQSGKSGDPPPDLL